MYLLYVMYLVHYFQDIETAVYLIFDNCSKIIDHKQIEIMVMVIKYRETLGHSQ